MAKHVRNGDAYGDGMFFFTQPVGAGGGYADGMFFFTQPVGAGGGYAGPMMVRRAHGFVHPSVARSSYGFVPKVGGGAMTRAGGGAAAAAGGTSASKSKLDEIEKLAKAQGKAEYWYALRTSYLNPSKRTVESFPVINVAGKPEGDMKPRDKSKLSERSKNEISQEEARLKDAKKALENKLSALRSGMSQAQKDALAAFVKQSRRVGAFNEIFRNNAKYRSYPDSPALYKLMIMDAGVKYTQKARTLANAVEVVRDYARLSPMSASANEDFLRKSVNALKGEGYTLKFDPRSTDSVSWPIFSAYEEPFRSELNILRGSLESARTSASDALKSARAALESAPAQTAAATGTSGAGGAAAATAGGAAADTATGGGAAADTSTGGGAAADTSTGGGETPPSVIPAVQPRILTEGYEVTPMESPIMVSGDTSAPAEASFFEKYKTEILVGGAIAAVLLFRKQLGIGGDAASAKE